MKKQSKLRIGASHLYSILALLLVLVLAASLSACGSDGQMGSSQSSVKPEPTLSSGVQPELEAAFSSVTPSEPLDAVSSSLTPEVPALTEIDVLAMEAGSILSQDELSALDIDQLFCESELTDEVFARMDGVSFPADCTISRDELRYLRVLHTGFDGETHIGELVCNRSISGDLLEIFRALYDSSYPIEKMLLIDNYGGDDNASMADNNTSCFNFRPVPGTEHLSAHAQGLAIDVNPLYNPYITASGYLPENAGDYTDRTSDFPYKIDEDDLCCQLFVQHGFFWGGNWKNVKDYQHFVMEE